jgi:hypothetical protein
MKTNSRGGRKAPEKGVWERGHSSLREPPNMAGSIQCRRQTCKFQLCTSFHFSESPFDPFFEFSFSLAYPTSSILRVCLRGTIVLERRWWLLLKLLLLLGWLLKLLLLGWLRKGGCRPVALVTCHCLIARTRQRLLRRSEGRTRCQRLWRLLLLVVWRRRLLVLLRRGIGRSRRLPKGLT